MKENFFVIPDREVWNNEEILLETDGYDFVAISNKLPENEFVDKIFSVFYPYKRRSLNVQLDMYMHHYDNGESKLDISFYLGKYPVVDLSNMK
jgi:hypothetical protein